MLTIHLRNISFRGFHGVHAEEHLTGGSFTINLNMELDEKNNILSLEQTIDYTEAYAIVSKHMKRGGALLETLAQRIAAEIMEMSPLIGKITISIFKEEPPIPSFQGSVGITLEKKRAM